MNDGSVLARRRGKSFGWLPIVAGLVVAVVAAADQFGLGWTRRAVAAHYGRFGQNPDPRLLTVLIMISSVMFAGWMALAAVQARRGRWGSFVVGAWSAIVLWGAWAVLATAAHEFDGFVLPLVWRILMWLLPLSALVALRPARPHTTIHV